MSRPRVHRTNQTFLRRRRVETGLVGGDAPGLVAGQTDSFAERCDAATRRESGEKEVRDLRLKTTLMTRMYGPAVRCKSLR
jgi:hypothetical protein